MVQVILAHNHFDVAHLTGVLKEMQKLGDPTIRGYWVEDYDVFQAIEGCHRLRAAAALGYTPDLIDIDPDTHWCDVDGLDYNDGSDPTEATVGEIGDNGNDELVFNNW